MTQLFHARMVLWFLISLVLMAFIAVTAPQQLPVSIYKLSLITTAAWVAYWLDRSLFPYARPDAFMSRPFSVGAPYCPQKVVNPEQQHAFCLAQLRRAIIIAAAMIAVALGA